MSPRYPDIEVVLSGEGVSPQTVMGRMCQALEDAGVLREEIDEFIREAVPSADRDQLLAACKRWVKVS